MSIIYTEGFDVLSHEWRAPIATDFFSLLNLQLSLFLSLCIVAGLWPHSLTLKWSWLSSVFMSLWIARVSVTTNVAYMSKVFYCRLIVSLTVSQKELASSSEAGCWYVLVKNLDVVQFLCVFMALFEQLWPLNHVHAGRCNNWTLLSIWKVLNLVDGTLVSCVCFLHTWNKVCDV